MTDTPTAGTWTIDPSHTTITAVARHLVVSRVRGSFREFEGTIDVASDPSESRVSLSINAASIDTGSEDRDAHLRSPDILDVENHPTLTFSSTAIEESGGGWRLVGDLTRRGETHPVEIDFEFLGTFVDPWGNEKAAFTGSGRIEREQWGVSWNAPIEAGGWLVSKHLDIELEVQAALQS